MWFKELFISFFFTLILLPKAVTGTWSGHIASYSHVVYWGSSYCSSHFLWWCAHTSYRLEWRTDTYFRCAPGWMDTNGNQNCVIPICNPPCQNGGTCVAPNKCACLDGFDGPDTSCTTLRCSHLLPCYPGTCISPNSCQCDDGFTGYGESACLTMTRNKGMPFVSLSRVTLANVRRTDNTTKFSYSMDGTSEEKDTVWSNQKDFNILKFEFNSIYISPQLPYRANYINDAQLGIVDGQITANISKIPRSGTNHDVAFQKQYKCPGIADTNPNNGIVDCIITDYQFSVPIEHGDWLSVVFIAKSGGFRNLVNFDHPDRIWDTQIYQGLTDQKEVEFKFDFYVPTHCSESNSTINCRVNDVPLKIENEFTKLPVNISWAGWKDDLSKMDRYHIEVFKLSPDPYGNLQEMNPLKPVHSEDVNHTHDGIYQYTYTPSEEGMFSVLLQAVDKANNSKIARRLVLYAPTSNISLNTYDDGRLYISSAESETGYMWQTTKAGQTTEISVEWKNHFINKFISEGKLLNKINAYPIQFQDIQREGILQSLKYVFPGLDDNEGQRTVDGKPNTHGVVRFEAVVSLSDGSNEPQKGWFDINGLAENFKFNETLRDGRTARIWVRAHDVLGNIISDKTEVHFDFSGPLVKNDSIVFSRNHPNGTYIYTSRIEFEAADLVSGVHKIGYVLRRDDTGNVQHNGSTFASQRNISCNTDLDCKCVLEKCFIQHQVLDLDNCWFMTSEEELDHVNITVEVIVYNQAMLKKSFYVTVDKLNELRGLEHYSGPTNIRVAKSNSNSVRLEWDLPKTQSCYGRTELVVILYLKDGVTKLYTVSRNTTFVDIIGLDPDENYTVAFSLGYGEQRMGNMPFSFQTAHNATTAPSVLERSDIECQTTSLKIFVPKHLVPGNGPVTWRDSSCVVHSNGTHFVDSVGLRDCGTALTLESDYVVFENDLIFHKNGTQMQNGSNIVTYGSDYEFAIPVKCVYPRNSNISTSYIPIVQQVKILERRNGQLDLTMRQYEAEDYNHAVPFNAYPRQVPLNNDIFIRLAMENNVTGLGLSADNCFATSTPSPVDPNWYQLISSGCPVNNAKIHPSGINDVKFSFHAFNFRHNTSGIVYVHCQVSVCLDTDPACVVGCVTRKKRSANVREGAITSNLISTGPFILTADEGGVAMSTVVAAVSIAVAVISTVVAIIGWTRKSKKGADS